MENPKKRVCIILPGKLPIPNIKGGAIETLITLLLEQNEIYNKVHFIVISAWAKGVEEATAKYRNTEFHYINIRKGLWKKGINFINYLIAVITGNIDYFKSPMHYDIENVVKQIAVDEILVEHGVYKHFEFLRKYYDREHLYLHLHGAGPMPDKKTKETFGHIITVSEFVKKLYIDSFKDYNTQFHVCLNGINDMNFKKRASQEEKNAIRKKYGVTQEDFLVIYCGRLIYEKGVEELVRAIINTRNQHIKLMVIGSSNFLGAKKTRYVKKLETLIKGYETQIIFTGYVSNMELYRYYQSADLQAVCSICEEAAPLVGIEGMMSGLPLITTDSGGIFEYVNETCCNVIYKRNSLHNMYDREQMSIQITKVLQHYYKNRNELKLKSLNSLKLANNFTGQKFYAHFINIIC